MSESIARRTHQALTAYQNAIAGLAENRLLEAMVEVRRSLEADPEFYDGQFLKAHLHRLLGQYEEAIPILKDCLASLSDDVEVLREAAEVALLAGEEKTSFDYYRRLLDLDPEDEGVCGRVAAVAFRLGGTRLALREVKRLLDDFPEWTAGYLCLGNLLELTGKPKQAKVAYRRALERAPNHRGASKNLERLDQGLPLEKGHYEYAYEELFLTEAARLARDGFEARASRMLDKWRPRFPNHPEFLEVLAKISFRLGRYRSALAAIEEMPTLRRDPEHLLLEARSLASLGDLEAAASRYEVICRKSSDSPEIWLDYVKVLEQTSVPGRSAQAVEEAIRRHPRNAELWFEAACIRKRYVDSQSCLSALERVVSIRPNHAKALYALGVEKLLSGDARGAVGPLSALTAMDRDHVEGWRHLAIAYTRLKEWRKAHASWSSVVRLAPEDPQAAGNLAKLEKLLNSRAVGIRRTGSV